MSCLVQIALITGGDSGIGRAAALMFAREGADLAISYLNEDRDAEVRAAGCSAAPRTVWLWHATSDIANRMQRCQASMQMVTT